jgi:exodeoxyribonuclease V alpha subunit
VFADLAADPSLSAQCVAELAVATGIPAAAIVPPAPRAPGVLQDTVVWLARNWRFATDSGIGRLAALINAGDGDALVAWLRGQSDPMVEWIDDGGERPGPAALARIVDGYAPYFEAVRRHPDDPAAVASAFDRFRVLCAVRDGPRGVAAINTLVEQRLHGERRDPWSAGRAVLVTRNDPLLQLANGDVGIALPEASGALAVWFRAADGGMRAVAPVRLPAHETAFAMTVHKAQGSEFDDVHLLLPARAVPVVTRELLYTAVTRARQHATLSAAADVVAAAAAAATRRAGGLLGRRL